LEVRQVHSVTQRVNPKEPEDVRGWNKGKQDHLQGGIMTDQELADKVLTILEGSKADKLNLYMGNEGEAPYYCLHHCVEFMGCDRFVRDWRVAGALMELCRDKVLWADLLPLAEESLPRAIIEACVEALI
jgi:hypothetical protein